MMADVSWGHVAGAVAVLVGAIAAGWSVRRLLARWLGRVVEDADSTARDLRIDLPALASAAGWLVAFLVLIVASEMRFWPTGSTFLLVLAGAVALVGTVTLLARGLSVARASALAMGLVLGLLLFSERFDVLSRITEPMDRVSFSFGEFEMSLLDLVRTVVAVLILWGLALVLYRVLRLAIRANDAWSGTQKLLAEKLTAIAVIAVGVMIAIDIAGLDSTMLSIFSGTLGLGIGFGLRSVFSNLVAGLLILMDRTVKPGDTIAVDDQVGEVTRVGVRRVRPHPRSQELPHPQRDAHHPDRRELGIRVARDPRVHHRGRRLRQRPGPRRRAAHDGRRRDRARPVRSPTHRAHHRTRLHGRAPRTSVLDR